MLAHTQIMMVVKLGGVCLEGWEIGFFLISFEPKESTLRSEREWNESTKARESHRCGVINEYVPYLTVTRGCLNVGLKETFWILDGAGGMRGHLWA